MAEIVSGPEGIARGVERLSGGSLVAFPTETVYGLGADALDARAVAKVFTLKGRPSNNPLIVHVSGEKMAQRVVAEWTDAAGKLARTFWPGPLTMVLPKAACVPDEVTAGGATVAVRCPAHPVALALIESFGNPIVGPSANPSGYISPTVPEHVRDGFGDDDLVVLDGGACRAGIESTVLDLSCDTPTVLRLGVIGAHRISETLGIEIWVADHAIQGQHVRSPGLVGAHYQPSKPMRVIETCRLNEAHAETVVVSWSLEGHPSGGSFVKVPGDVEGYAQAMYAALNRSDRAAGSSIWVEQPPTPVDEDGCAIVEAIRERLSRAAKR
jgi:L-threonylcarbamoyladenylate synthase